MITWIKVLTNLQIIVYFTINELQMTTKIKAMSLIPRRRELNNTFYERMFKIDTRMKGKTHLLSNFLIYENIDKEGNLKDGGSIMLNLTELLRLLFNEPVSSGKGFDKKAKSIIRSQYKLINEKSNTNQLFKTKLDSSQSERKDYSSRSALAALASENASTSDAHRSPGDLAQQTNSKKIENYYSGEINPKGNDINSDNLETFNPLQHFQNATSDQFENKLLDFGELETMRNEIQRVQAEKDEIQILIDERDRTIRILKNDASDKSTELARLADENINFREAISNPKFLICIENQNERFKDKIDEMNQINDDKEEEINRLIELLKDHESQQQSENGIYYILILL